MNKKGWSYSIIIRYTLLQLPGLALIVGLMILVQRWIYYPSWIIWITACILTAIDVVLFFYTWPSYDWSQKETMIGEIGVTLERLNPTGYIRIHGENWKAEVLDQGVSIEAGQKVEVHARDGLILKIKAL